MGKRNSTGHWRYKVMKLYRRRAQRFRDLSLTFEEKQAWGKVIKWFDSILDYRYLNEGGAICIPEIEELS